MIPIIGEIKMNGEPLDGSITGQEMCQAVIDAGLFSGTADELWDSEAGKGADLSFIAELYYLALYGQGHVLEVYNGEKFMPMFKPKQPFTNQQDNKKGEL